MVAASQRALGLAAAICALLLAAAPSAAAQASPDSAPGPVAPYQAPLAPAAGPALPPAQAAVATIGTSGLPSWGTFLKAADADGVQQRVGVLTLTQDRAGKMFFNTTFTADVGPGNPVQSVLVSLPPFINSTAATLAVLYFNATQQAVVPVVANVSDNATSWSLTGPAAPVPGVSMPELLTNLSLGHAVINIYTANFPQPLQPMGCCNNAEVRSEGSVEPINSAALPAGGLRQDHHGFERVPLQRADSLPYHAYLEAADPTVNTTATGLIQLQVAPDNSSVVYNVTLGGLAATNEIFNVSIWFGNGKTRRLGWFPYSLYSFASNRLPTPRGGLLPPTNGANFTLATGWIGRWVDAVSRKTVNDPTYEYGIQQLVSGNVYVVIGTAKYPQGELSGHAVLGWGTAPS